MAAANRINMHVSGSQALELAAQCVDRGDNWGAAEQLRRALASTVPLADTWETAVRIAGQIGDDHSAVRAAQRLYDQSKRQPAHAALLADALTQSGDPAAAADLLVPLADAGKLSPDQIFKLTRDLMFAGRMEEAQRRARALLTSHADSPTLWERIAQTKRFVQNDPDIDVMRKVFARWTMARPEGRSAIATALARAFVDIGDDQAANEFLEARALAGRTRFAFDPKPLAAGLRDIVEWCDSGEQDVAPAISSGSERPIFILGPARSGTSLLDQIFSRHSAIKGGGELRHFWLAARELGDCSSLSLKKFAQRGGNQAPPGDPWAEFGRRYLSLADERFGSAAKFTDKLLSNLYRVRAILRALPNAHFIYIDRQPLAVAWSCWRSQFDADSAWSNSADGIALYVTVYRWAMEAWMTRFPNSFTKVSYERLASEPDKEIPRLLAGCGLSDEVTTRQPQHSTRPVITMSFAQVREPIHTRSIDAVAAFPISTRKLRAALEAMGGIAT